MKRRKSPSSSNNPLADARKGKRKNNVDALWHRKTGAGYRLFVSYYSTQPMGVVVCPSADASESSTPDTSSSQVIIKGGAIHQRAQNCNAKGMSRASKRRKKKQGKAIVVDTVCSPPSSPLESDLGGNKEDDEEERPLLNALDSIVTSKQYHNEGSTLAASASVPAFRSFLCALSRPLPLSFRIREGLDAASEHDLRKELTAFCNLVGPCCSLAIMGDNTNKIYQSKNDTHRLLVSKSSLKDVSPALKRFLNENTLNGRLARQELGSMLPGLLLQATQAIAPHSRVLDLCASPGSKTLQAAELVGLKGRVRANDVNPDRLKTLQDAVARSGIANTGVVKFSNLDACQFPIPAEPKKYDVVLCDVPCSGDGTCRKDASILVNWSPKIANALHATQLMILTRALECVKVGGVVSYSTCSLNPVENEAVVAAALLAKVLVSKQSATSSLSFELISLPPLESLILRSGVVDWKVADYATSGSEQVIDYADDDNDDDSSETPFLQWYASYSDAVTAGMEHAVPTLWPNRNPCPPMPPSTSSSAAQQPAPPPPLERCGRLWPQDQDTGGFFVALIRRTA